MWRNRGLILFFILCSGYLVSHYGGRISYAFFYFSLALPISALIYTLYVGIRFRYHQQAVSAKIVKEEAADFVFILSNEDIISYGGISFRFDETRSRLIGIDQNKIYTLLPGEKETIHAKLCCHYRGEYNVGIERIVIRDYMNLWAIPFPVHSMLEVTVFPRIIPWEHTKLVNLDEDEKRRMYLGIQEEALDHELRGYLQGDPMKRIEWKNSAKYQELFVRKSRAVNRRSITIFIDMQKPKADAFILEDKLMEEALSLVAYLRGWGIASSIVYECEKKKITEIPILCKEDMDAFYLWTAKAEFKGNVPLEKLLTEYEGKSDNRQFLLMTTQLTKSLGETMLWCQQKGLEAGILVMHLKSNEEDKKRYSELIKKGLLVEEVVV